MNVCFFLVRFWVRWRGFEECFPWRCFGLYEWCSALAVGYYCAVSTLISQELYRLVVLSAKMAKGRNRRPFFYPFSRLLGAKCWPLHHISEL